jgi:hypothetical protein
MPGGEATRVLVMTRDMFDAREGWKALGARRLPKPINARALATILEEMTAGTRSTGISKHQRILDDPPEP